MPFSHVFGDQWWAIPLPLDPVFNDPGAVLHYELGSREYIDYC